MLLTRAAEPELDPPAMRVGSWGLRTGPVDDRKLAPLKQKNSHTDLPQIWPPAKFNMLIEFLHEHDFSFKVYLDILHF